MAPRFQFAFEAADYDASVWFYRDALGLPVVDSWDRGNDRGTFFQAAAGIIEVVSQSGDLRGPKKQGVVIEVDDAVETFRAIGGRGVTVLWEPQRRPWGTIEFVVLDPDGNAVTYFSSDDGSERAADGAVSIRRAASSLPGPFQPVDLATVNDAIVRLARLQGAFPWHHHDEDELFICLDGTFTIEIQGRDSVTLGADDLFVVPRGVEHRPIAAAAAHILLLERPETQQYGN
ncbi:MAG TPA: VOC family protein [Actinomycetota bacterium]|jgi:mannose-6-phosphate isomerase-like protein (cupin superfamily)|nr:VOC family protein [Actinomycetota bacterium]